MFVRKGERLGSIQVDPSDAESAEDPTPESEPVKAPKSVETPEPVDELEPEEADESEVLERPKDYDNKPEWVDFAVSKGADRDEAEGLTKPELIELYGGEE